MLFVLRDDIETDKHYPSGSVLTMEEMSSLLVDCEVVTAHCFLTMDDVNEWLASQSV